MARAIEELEIDHRNMRQLLAIIEEEMDAYGRGSTPDFELLHLIVDYILNYPEISHHPREDAIYAVLLRRDPVGAVAVGNLMEEHRQLSALTHRLAAAVANVERDVETPREWLDALVRDYIARNRAHMRAEEQQFFRRAIAALSEADWTEIDAKLQRLIDPLFGGKVTNDYLRLYQRIMALHL
jgi:hemerythrin-like domain-containing protein